jgi:hypothetical protein
MKIRITIDCFSGRENPAIVLDEKDAKPVLEKIKLGRSLDPADAAPVRHRLGYRGVIVELLDGGDTRLPRRFLVSADRIFGDSTAVHLDEPGLERTLVTPDSLVHRFKLDRYTADWIAKDAEAALKPGLGTLLPPPWRIPPIIILQHENQAPIFEPTWWNDGSTRQYGNNCYNYSCDYRSDSFAQPGRASGHMYPEITSAAVKAGAVSDDLIDTPAANNKFPAAGHLVALVIAPGYDFHWYRKDMGGKWSHKPGGTAATNLDNAGHEITDPRTANRGPYTEFTTFMNVKHGHIKLH